MPFQINEITKYRKDDMGPDINAKEALYGFVAWLSTRPEAVTLSSKHSPSDVVDLIEQWAEVNNLHPVREDQYPDNIMQPKE